MGVVGLVILGFVLGEEELDITASSGVAAALPFVDDLGDAIGIEIALIEPKLITPISKDGALEEGSEAD